MKRAIVIDLRALRSGPWRVLSFSIQIRLPMPPYQMEQLQERLLLLGNLALAYHLDKADKSIIEADARVLIQMT